MHHLWILIDSARGPYASLITLFVFSAYFATVVVPDPVKGQALWSYASSIAALLIAVGAPVVGAIADAGGTRKPWIGVLVGMGFLIVGFALLVRVRGGPASYVAGS